MRFHMHHHGGGGASAGTALPSLPPSSASNADLVKLESPDLHFRRDGSVLQVLTEKDPESEEKAEGPETEEAEAEAVPPSQEAEITTTTPAGEMPAPSDTPETETPPEQEWVEVSLVRLFPLTDPDNWISVLSKDGREIGVITELRALSHENLAVVEEELQRRYLVPHVRQIFSVKSRYDLMEWTVDTDRGRAVFLTRNAREQLQNTATRHITITDVEGNRYDIQDVGALDPVSKKRLDEQF